MKRQHVTLQIFALLAAGALLLFSTPARAGGDNLRARFHTLPEPAKGAKVVGDETCAECHEDIQKSFAKTIHHRITEAERGGQTGGCESCHGPGSAHAEEQDPALIRSFGPDAPEAALTCTYCHKGQNLMDWNMSSHHQAGVDCSACHTVHPKKGAKSKDPDRCEDCHADTVARFRLPSHHPVLEHKMKCASCHEVHGRFDSSLKTSERPNELCIECHASKQGPFVFQHEPVEEDCMNCHNPHGAVAKSLLQQNEPFLCLTCHPIHFHAGLESSADSEVTVGGVTFQNLGHTSYKPAFTTKCTQCHSQIHGSDLPSQAVTGRGGSLTR
ncbi:GSU2203 family decaheme c-type cytochrome [Acidobacteriota bacterium]